MEYFKFYKFREDPFGITPDPDFFYPSKWHNEALQSMEYLVNKGEGFMLITGGPGTGKTMIIRTFLKNFQEKVFPSVIYHSTIGPLEFIKSTLNSLLSGISSKRVIKIPEGKTDIIRVLTNELIKRHKRGIKNILIVDEAQDLPDDTLIEIKHLSNIETEKEKLLHFVLLGQPYFEDKLAHSEYAQLNQRITIRARLFNFDRDEVESYIKFRIQRGGEAPVTFDKGAIKLIHKASRGVPRLINLICSRALMVGYMNSSYIIKKSYVKASIKHLNL